MKNKGTKCNDPIHNFSLKSPYPLSVLNDECWNWTGAKDKDGYGVFTLEKKKTPAHVAAYTLAVGKPYEGMYVLHTCHNPSCVNPEHLYEGTQWQNIQDQKKAGTFVSGSKNGMAKLTEDDIPKIRNSELSCRDLAIQFNVSYHTIWDVLRGRKWKQVL